MPEPELPEARDPFERVIALCVAVLAVALAFVDNTGNNGQAEAIVKTSLAANQWAHYQAKSLKENLAESDAALLAVLAPSGSAQAQSKRDEVKKESARYEVEKKEIKAKAESLQKEAERGQKIDDQCDVAALFLQIAVVICSIAILVRWRAIFFVGASVGLVGVYQSVIAFMM